MSVSLERSTEDQQLAQQQILEEEEEHEPQGNVSVAHPLDLLMVRGLCKYLPHLLGGPPSCLRLSHVVRVLWESGRHGHG